MNNKNSTILFFYIFIPLFLLINSCSGSKVIPIKSSINRADALVIDHTCTDISKILEHWIQKAKSEFGISYGHTSHGSQIVNGMKVLMD